jgi:hypothetical protein
MLCDEVVEKIVAVDEETDETECDAVCDLDCSNCSWKE